MVLVCKYVIYVYGDLVVFTIEGRDVILVFIIIYTSQLLKQLKIFYYIVCSVYCT